MQRNMSNFTAFTLYFYYVVVHFILLYRCIKIMEMCILTSISSSVFVQQIPFHQSTVVFLMMRAVRVGDGV